MTDIVKLINYLLIGGVLQGFGFNLVTLFVKKKFNKTIVFLNLTILFISLNNLQRWLIDNDYSSSDLFQDPSVLFLLENLLVPWYFLIFPMFYAFTVYFVNVQDKVNDFLKPSIAVFILEIAIRLCLISYVWWSGDRNNTDLIMAYTQIEDGVNLAIGIFLFANACLLIFKRHHLLNYIMSYDDLNWIKWIIRLGIVAIACWAVAYAYVSYFIKIHSEMGITDAYKQAHDTAYLPLRFVTSILLYWLGYQGFYKYNVVQDRIYLRSSINSNDLLIAPTKYTKPIEQNDDFFNKKHQADFEKIKDHIIQNKLYLDPLLSMEAVTSDLGMSKSYFSKLINSYSQYNFSDFINSLRVEQAKKFLANDEFGDYTMVAIGLECGFNSKSTFYSAFKKFTSQTPTTFREQF